MRVVGKFIRLSKIAGSKQENGFLRIPRTNQLMKRAVAGTEQSCQSVHRLLARLIVVCLLCAGPPVIRTQAQQPDSLLPRDGTQVVARVSPVLEIEVLDPNRDARGNPAVVLTTDAAGQPQIDIPPTLIVHRYYYSGDRSFRGPDLPGGPSIVIAQNPRDGQQVYLPVQMLPGSPIVRYTARRIEYDFGNRAVIVSFPKVGRPAVSYRNGRPLAETSSKLLGIDKLRAAWDGTKNSLATVKEKTATATQATGLAIGNLARPLTLPAQHLARLLPGHAALTDPNLETRVTEETAIHQRQRELDQARAQARVAQADIPVPR